ncbi:MAG: hypothetical protein AAFP84_08940, partial [Actinomycetota bacterium]
VGGATFDRTFTDERIDAIAPISPQGADQFSAFDDGPDDNTWTTVTIPAYNLVGGDEIDTNATGTIDEPGWRLTPFERYPAVGDKFLTVIDGQDHRDMWQDGSIEVNAFIATEITEFFLVYVVGDPTADACSIGALDREDSSSVSAQTDRIADPAGRLGECDSDSDSDSDGDGDGDGDSDGDGDRDGGGGPSGLRVVGPASADALGERVNAAAAPVAD